MVLRKKKGKSKSASVQAGIGHHDQTIRPQNFMKSEN